MTKNRREYTLRLKYGLWRYGDVERDQLFFIAINIGITHHKHCFISAGCGIYVVILRCQRHCRDILDNHNARNISVYAVQVKRATDSPVFVCGITSFKPHMR